MENNFALIVAGGKGMRMEHEIPKQFIELDGLPILMHTLQCFYEADPKLTLILILPEDQISNWESLVMEFSFKVPYQIEAGGRNRTESVRNGLQRVKGEGLVAIHDGVRPFVSPKLIQDSFYYASRYGNAIAAVKVKDSIRQVHGEFSEAVNRENFYLVQTPQTFKIPLIKQAYETINPENSSDDATVLEEFGEQIYLIEGSYENIKITTPEDLELAGLLLNKFKKR